MKKDLKIALIQTDLVWENPEQNRVNFTKKIKNISEDVDIIVLPEMFTSGFTMNASAVAETMDGKTVTWLKELALQVDAAIIGSMVILEGNAFYNRLLFVMPSGQVSHYDKRHSFTLVGEEKVYTSGIKKVIVDYKGWKICPLICYDLRFPVWARNTEDYDVLLYVANWPKPRVSAWDTLLKARAIENMSYCVGVNRVGVDGVNAVYSGHSAVYDVLGQQLVTCAPNEDTIKIATLEKRHVEAYRNKFKFLNDKDQFEFT
ncbi:amidohydrolase [Algibacter amylolyticus]|uniref:Omega-amidase YafV n=1 Tax=Algibacter amylolyticus TaxID=1608400 RepID=A0A5M7BGG3_9FLAO|nr:amidohydrolase [Algibacter amylolyticus]KAA5827900.1 amidohydrolase [Algibacter amylolyticus]MBB5267133.1 putative amidohydrolase [Algibacter amylolyticus]TSJ82145.1 amidohydrolase [Algibacter amylolyticus]